jgi:hypothetical protein
LEEEAWEEEKDECAGSDIDEITVSRHSDFVLVFFGMESVEDGTGDEVLGPDHACGPYKEPATQTGETETGKLSRENEKNGEAKAKTDVIVMFANDNSVECVGGTDSDIGHNEDKSMFLDVPRARVERVFRATEPSGETVCGDGEDDGKEFPDGVCDEEEEEGNDGRSGGTEVEEDVEARADTVQEQADHPHTNGHCGHLRIVDVGDGRAHLRVRRVFFFDCVKVELHPASGLLM